MDLGTQRGRKLVVYPPSSPHVTGEITAPKGIRPQSLEPAKVTLYGKENFKKKFFLSILLI